MITLSAMIRQLREEKEALDATIVALEQLARKQKGPGSKINCAVEGSSETVAPRQPSHDDRP
jgi:hypothetical protein